MSCSLKHGGTARVESFADVSYFTVTHVDTAAADGLEAGDDHYHEEAASQVHLTQVHDLVLRISDDLHLIRGEQRHFRRRCVLRDQWLLFHDRYT
jgi:hypothetical protein